MANATSQPARSRRARVDPAVVDAARSGDRHAMDILVRATQHDVYGLAFHLSRNHADAEDIVQEAYLRAFRGLSTYRADAAFTTWLYRIVHNTFVNLKRSQSRREALNTAARERYREPVSTKPDAQAVKAETQARLEAAISDLPPNQRAVFVLFTYRGLPYDEIAQVMEITRENVKVTLSHARKKLRATLERGG